MILKDSVSANELLNASPFTEIPTLATLTEAQLIHIQMAGEEIVRARMKSFNLPNGTILVSTLDELKTGLETQREVPVWQVTHKYSNNGHPSKGKQPIVLNENGTIEKSTSVLVAEAGELLHVGMRNDSHLPMITYGDDENWHLFEAGVPVLLVDLLTFSQHKEGQQLANIVNRHRLGEGVVPGERDQYIVLKLVKPDTNGNKILMQKIGE